jgi:hypothetical protein
MLEHASRWCRRRPAFASLLAVLALTVASSLVGLLTLRRHSEAERSRAGVALSRAIASERATSGAVRDLVDLLTTTVDAPHMLVSERLEEASRVVRDLTAKLRRERPFATANLVAICDLECKLAEALQPRGKHSDARGLLMDSLELLEGRRRTADDPDVDEAYARTLLRLGWGDCYQEDLDAALVWVERAGEALKSLVQDPRRFETIASLDQTRLMIAARLGRRGLEAQRRKLLESRICILEHPSDSGGADPAIGLFAALARAELATDDRTIARLHAAIARFPANRRLPEPCLWRVGDWIANDINPYPSALDPAGEPMSGLDPDAQADRVIRALESRCEALGVDHSVFPTAARGVAYLAVSRGVEQRRAGHLDDARRTASCLSAFAEEIVRRNPHEAVFRMIRCMAFEQESKNARKAGDRAVIERTLRRALDEAGIALHLDPHSLHARLSVASLQDKLIRLNATRASSP